MRSGHVVYALAGLVVLFLVVLVLGAVTGRVKVRGCCSAADATRDRRMRAAFEDEPAAPVAVPDEPIARGGHPS
jgi:hypothetical protein